jgi:choline dehydrogenase
MRWCAALLASSLGTLASGCASLLRPQTATSAQCRNATTEGPFDYVVVGSGAGGGPLACNLALAGFRVLLLEAGGEEDSLEYEVPAFHALASEDERYAWNFYVRHYADRAQQARDCKYVPERDGVLYPRCSTLGGCTAHNAMICVYPHNGDWDRIAALTGDATWGSDDMRALFQRVERCEYRIRAATHRRGFGGWLPLNVADPLLAARDANVQSLVWESVTALLGPVQGRLDRLLGRVRQGIDPNDWSFVADNATGLCMTPMSTDGVRRVGSRELIRCVRAACPDRLVVQTHALATRVVLDTQLRATGVEYLTGERLYRAAPPPGMPEGGQRATAIASREVIVCAGAFNSPQLLMLSGIGPRADLERLGIRPRVDLPGVGRNLQDRYEISVISRARREFELMRGMSLRPPVAGEAGDEPFREWRNGAGPYTTNGVVTSIVKRSASAGAEPDLFMFALLGSFRGYYPKYAQDIVKRKDVFTWAILKGHTRNRSGCVKLRSADPRDVPHIEFNYFAGEGGEQDLDAMVEAVETVRDINRACGDVIAEEIEPGAECATRDALRRYIRDQAWGHHACGTCRIGPPTDDDAVVDSAFRVRGTKGLRVVDASVFPYIPGFFIACAVYMIAEKASDAIVADARAGGAADG